MKVISGKIDILPNRAYSRLLFVIFLQFRNQIVEETQCSLNIFQGDSFIYSVNSVTIGGSGILS